MQSINPSKYRHLLTMSCGAARRPSQRRSCTTRSILSRPSLRSRTQWRPTKRRSETLGPLWRSAHAALVVQTIKCRVKSARSDAFSWHFAGSLMPHEARRALVWRVSLQTRLSPHQRTKARQSRSARTCTRWLKRIRPSPTSLGKNFVILAHFGFDFARESDERTMSTSARTSRTRHTRIASRITKFCVRKSAHYFVVCIKRRASSTHMHNWLFFLFHASYCDQFFLAVLRLRKMKCPCGASDFETILYSWEFFLFVFA